LIDIEPVANPSLSKTALAYLQQPLRTVSNSDLRTTWLPILGFGVVGLRLFALAADSAPWRKAVQHGLMRAGLREWNRR
jgi:hypothetical protein